MQLGIKIGPDTWQNRLEESKTKLCEVWFRPDWIKKYQRMFHYIEKNNIKCGLHFWGICKNNIHPSLVTKKESIRKESIYLMKECINIASSYGFYYLNAHPESKRLFRLLPPDGKVELMDIITDDEEGYNNLLLSAKELTGYAKKRNVLFVLETIPRFSLKSFWSQLKRDPIDINFVPSNWLVKLGKEGIAINLDIGHTITENPSNNPEKLVKSLLEKTKKLTPFTKVLHLSTTSPPFNGTDSHNGFTKKDYQIGAIPSLKDLGKILEIFRGKDVYIIPEPQTDHIKNYSVLSNLLESISTK